MLLCNNSYNYFEIFDFPLLLSQHMSIYRTLFCICLSGCMAREVQHEPDPQSLRANLEPTEVKVSLAVVKPFTHHIESNGKIEAAQVAELQFKTGGLLKELKARNGQRVKKGTKIAQLDDQEAQLRLRKAESVLKIAQFEYQNKMLSYGKNELAGAHGNTIKESIRYSSGLAAAEIDREEAQIKLAHTRVLTPFTGLIANVQYKTGNYVNAGDKLCDLFNPAKLVVTSSILESDLGKLQLGQKAAIFPLSSSDQTFEAILAEINPQVDATGLIGIKLAIQNPGKRLLPGMNVKLSLAIPKYEALVVPKEAVVVRSGKQVVFVAEDGLAKWHYVTTGLDNGDEVEIIEGLEEGMAIITSNNLQLAHDAPVKASPE